MIKLFALNSRVLFYKEYCSNVETGVVYRNIKWRLLKLLRRLHLKYKIPCYSIWYSKYFKSIRKIDNQTIIIFDSVLNISAANWLILKNNKNRVIFWHWNHIDDERVFVKLHPLIERWSYDVHDCLKHKNIKYNSQFYFPELVTNKACDILLNDFFFIGKEKGRNEYIEYCKGIIEKEQLSYNFIVIDKFTTDKRLSYTEIIEEIHRTRCIVDLVLPMQKGLTLRPLEALFFSKKLITNNKDIVNYDFYRKENIYVLGIDETRRSLQDFLKTPYREIPNEIKNYYEFKSWLERFSY